MREGDFSAANTLAFRTFSEEFPAALAERLKSSYRIYGEDEWDGENTPDLKITLLTNVPDELPWKTDDGTPVITKESVCRQTSTDIMLDASSLLNEEEVKP